MPLDTLERTPPPFFKQGPSALSRLMVYSALALFLMVADARFAVTQPLRAAIATVLYPLQWMALKPVQWVRDGASYLESLHAAQNEEDQARRALLLQSQRAMQVEHLTLENERLRQLLALRDRVGSSAQAAEVLYDAADPYTRKVIIDKGLAHGVATGAPVIDEAGVLGQVTRVHPLISEVTLVIDRDQAIPVLNTRTGARSLAFGNPQASAAALELRFIPGNADVQAGDLLTTSGVDGVYPPGLAVAKVERVERRADSAFARIYCTPQALIDAARHVMVLKPVTVQVAPRPPEVSDPGPAKPKKRTPNK